MSDKRSNEQLDNLRERLYARGVDIKRPARTTLPEDKPSVPNNWNDNQPPAPPRTPTGEASPPPARKKNYRGILLLVALAFFVLSVTISSLYILLGRNTVSGNNIDLALSAPFSINGGDVMSLQVGLTNHNSVPVESATLVIEYPEGTRNTNDPSGELHTQRLPLSVIGAGETLNVPLRARIFGEENQELEIRASVEYRVQGSNATFYKEADVHRFKVGSAPVVLSIKSEEKISSGEEVDVTLTVRNNSADTIKDLLIKAEYPNGFDYSSAEPAPTSGRDTWRISELAAESETTVTVTGVIIGTESEKRTVRFSAGLGSERSPLNLSSIMAMTDTEFTLEEPFLDVGVKINGDSAETISIAPDGRANVTIELKNNLSSAVYDTTLEVVLSGNALADTRVQSTDGYYNSTSRTIQWQAGTDRSLRKIDPGETVRLSFSLEPEAEGVRTPQLQFAVKATGRRVSESNAREEISGNLSRVIKIESKPDLQASVSHQSGDSGPVPPVVGKSTTYTLEWRVVSTANAIANTTVSATLPSYVTWTGVTSGQGSWSYNPTTRVVEWAVGEVAGDSVATGSFKVSFLPSSSQIGRTPELVGSASLRATDSFTGSILRDSVSSLNTGAAGSNGDGEVQAD